MLSQLIRIAAPLALAVAAGAIVIAFPEGPHALAVSARRTERTAPKNVPTARIPVVPNNRLLYPPLPASRIIDEANEASSLDSLRFEMDIESLRRAARDLEWSAQRFNDGASDWRHVLPDVEYNLDRTRRRLRDVEWSAQQAGANPYADLELSRLRRDLREMEFDVLRARTGDRWSGIVPNLESGAYDINRSARRLGDPFLVP